MRQKAAEAEGNSFTHTLPARPRAHRCWPSVLSLLTTAKRKGRDPLTLLNSVLFNGGDTPATVICGSENDTS